MHLQFASWSFKSSPFACSVLDCLVCSSSIFDLFYQVMIEGIGVFGVVLGQDFASSGFMHSSLYLLLRKLISSSVQIRIASDAVLRVLAAAGGYCSVIHGLISCKIFFPYLLDFAFMFFLPPCTGWSICCGKCRLHC